MSNLFGGTCEIYAIIGQKGGIAKTTTAINLATYLALAGKHVVLLDADPQGDSTRHVWGTMPEELLALNPMLLDPKTHPTFSELLTSATVTVEEVCYTNTYGLKVIPANRRLDDTDSSITPPQVRGLLMPIMQEMVVGTDYIIIDTRRSGSRLTKSVIRVADKLLMPMQAEYLSMENVEPTIEDVEEMKKLNPQVQLLGILPTMVTRSRVSKNVKQEIQESVTNAEDRLGVTRGTYSDKILSIQIERSVRHAEASGARLPIQLYLEAITKGWNEERTAKEMEQTLGYRQLTDLVLAS